MRRENIFSRWKTFLVQPIWEHTYFGIRGQHLTNSVTRFWNNFLITDRGERKAKIKLGMVLKGSTWCGIGGNWCAWFLCFARSMYKNNILLSRSRPSGISYLMPQTKKKLALEIILNKELGLLPSFSIGKDQNWKTSLFKMYLGQSKGRTLNGCWMVPLLQTPAIFRLLEAAMNFLS